MSDFARKIVYCFAVGLIVGGLTGFLTAIPMYESSDRTKYLQDHSRYREYKKELKQYQEAARAYQPGSFGFGPPSLNDYNKPDHFKFNILTAIVVVLIVAGGTYIVLEYREGTQTKSE